MTVDPLIQSLKGKLVVSVQAYMGEPLRTPETMAQMSRACELGGAAAIRCQGLADIAAIKGRCEVPVIGLCFDLVSTTLSHGVAAIDCTMADGPDLPLLRQATEEFPGLPIICEGRVHTPEEARAAIDAGAWAVVVGTAITHPTSITSWFKAALEA